MGTVATLAGVTLDCPRPGELAEFYQRMCGGDIVFRSEEFVYLEVSGVGLGFQADPAYRVPTWPAPDTPQQCHVDFRTADLDGAEAAALEAGATALSHQPNPRYWRVLLDPAGHPFCLSTYGTTSGPDVAAE